MVTVDSTAVGAKTRAGAVAAATLAVAMTVGLVVVTPASGAAAPADGSTAAAGSRTWAQTSTGQVSVMTLAQPSASVTWAGGAEITTIPEGGMEITRFTPAMYQRDTALGGAWHRTPLPGADAWDSRINDIATAADGSAFLVGDQSPSDQAVDDRVAGDQAPRDRVVDGSVITPDGSGSAGGPDARAAHRTSASSADPADQGTSAVHAATAAGHGVLVGRYVHGAWQLTGDADLPAGTVDASLLSVSALSGHDAWAVGEGYAQDTYAQVPLVQHWDGRHWRQMTIPGSADWGLYQVHEVAPNDVWVVGADYDTGQAVAVHWNGHGWTRTATPAFPDSAALFDIAARGPHDVWAVGWSRDTGKQRPAGLALHWDGTSWRQVPLPAGTFALQAVTLRRHGGIAVVGGNDDAAVGLDWAPRMGWRSLGLPASDPALPLGVSSVVSGPGNHLTVGGWHFRVGDDGDSFGSGVLLTR